MDDIEQDSDRLIGESIGTSKSDVWQPETDQLIELRQLRVGETCEAPYRCTAAQPHENRNKKQTDKT